MKSFMNPLPLSRLPGNRGDSYSYRSHVSQEDISLAGRMAKVNTKTPQKNSVGGGGFTSGFTSGGAINFAGVEERFKNDENLEQVRIRREFMFENHI